MSITKDNCNNVESVLDNTTRSADEERFLDDAISPVQTCKKYETFNCV